MPEIGQTRADLGHPRAWREGLPEVRADRWGAVFGFVEHSYPAAPFDGASPPALLRGYARGIMQRARS